MSFLIFTWILFPCSLLQDQLKRPKGQFDQLNVFMYFSSYIWYLHLWQVIIWMKMFGKMHIKVYILNSIRLSHIKLCFSWNMGSYNFGILCTFILCNETPMRGHIDSWNIFFSFALWNFVYLLAWIFFKPENIHFWAYKEKEKVDHNLRLWKPSLEKPADLLTWEPNNIKSYFFT